MKAHNLFFHYFPPPNFLAMPAAGVDISDRSVRFARLKRKGDYLVLDTYGERKLPEDVVVLGEVKDKEALKTTLKRLKNDYNIRFVRASLSEQQSYLVKIRIPRVRLSQIRETIELQLEEYVPLSPKDAFFDYTITPCSHDGEPDFYDVGVAVMPKIVVSEYQKIFSEVGLLPLSFELEAHAIKRALVSDNDCSAIMIVDIGATRSGISIVSDGIIRFTSTINIGGNELTKAISQGLTVDFATAKRRKEQEGISQRNGELFRVLSPVISSLSDEVQQRFVYWHTHQNGEEKKGSKNKKIEKIILCGGEANVPGLLEYLEANMRIPIELGNPWMNIAPRDRYIPDLPYNHSLRYVTALGLALRGF